MHLLLSPILGIQSNDGLEESETYESAVHTHIVPIFS